MAELPGWDRGRLATASPRDLEAARLIVYARAWAPTVRRDIAGKIEGYEADIRQARLTKLEGNNHKIAAARETDRAIARLNEAIAELGTEMGHQAAIRATLELDVEETEPDSPEDLG